MKKKTFGAIEKPKKFHNRRFHKIENPVCPKRFFFVTNSLRLMKWTKEIINQDGRLSEARKAPIDFIFLFN